MRFKNYLPGMVLFGLLLVISGMFLIEGNQKLPIPTREEIPLQTLELRVEDDGESDYFFVKRIIDGDTIEVSDATRVRYIGIDTPETGDCRGEGAKMVNESLVGGKKIKLEDDIEKLDKYGRRLAYVWVDGLFVNEELVKRGVATVITYPPNVRYVDRFLEAQQEAKEERLGIWGENVCGDDEGAVEGVSVSTSSDCLIKGNISVSGEKIYHMPGQKYFDKTQVDETKGEKWFCSEGDAVAAGWRKSKL